MREQVEHGVADQTDGRLVTGDDQQDDHPEHLLLGEGVALVAGGQERADEVVRRRGAARGEELAEIGDELAHQLEELLQRLRPERGR